MSNVTVLTKYVEHQTLTSLFCQDFDCIKCEMISTGMGKTIVLFFSADITFKVCK